MPLFKREKILPLQIHARPNHSNGVCVRTMWQKERNQRRRLRTMQQLVSATVPLDRDSAWFVHDMIVQLGLSNYTAMPHVTFVEGLNSPPPTKELDALYLAMKEDPRLTIVKANCVPTRRDKGMELVCLELQIYSATLELATHSLGSHEHCRLPQWLQSHRLVQLPIHSVGNIEGR